MGPTCSNSHLLNFQLAQVPTLLNFPLAQFPTCSSSHLAQLPILLNFQLAQLPTLLNFRLAQLPSCSTSSCSTWQGLSCDSRLSSLILLFHSVRLTSTPLLIYIL